MKENTDFDKKYYSCEAGNIMLHEKQPSDITTC